MAGSSLDGLRGVVRELRGGFVFLPAQITLAMAGLALGLAAVEERVESIEACRDLLNRVFPPEPEAARVVLGTIAGSMVTVVSVVYSILLVVLTFASAQFSPRVLVAFVEDRVSQTTLGVFVGTFVYCLLTLAAVRSRPGPFVPSVAVIAAMVLAVACLACLFYFIHHIAVSIQANHIVDRIARETERILDDLLPIPLGTSNAEEALDPMVAGEPVLASASGYIRSIDEAGLLASAAARGVTLAARRHIGQFVAAGTPLLEVSPPAGATAALRAACLRAFRVGPARTMEQDVEFGVLQIVDIALKAVSPAVNDPTTAITCVDQLGRLLVLASMREPPSATLRGPDGVARVVLQRTSFPRLLDVAFSQIRHYGRADVAVPLRLMRVLRELADATPSGPYARAILDQAHGLVAACAAGFPDQDRDELNERLAAVERAVASTLDGARAASPRDR